MVFSNLMRSVHFTVKNAGSEVLSLYYYWVSRFGEKTLIHSKGEIIKINTIRENSMYSYNKR